MFGSLTPSSVGAPAARPAPEQTGRIPLTISQICALASGQRSTGEFLYLTYGEQLRRGMPTAEDYRGGKVLITKFTPLDDWRDCTVYPWRKGSNEGIVKRALRIRSNAFLPSPRPTDCCAVPRCQAGYINLQYHHIKPTFDDIVDQAILLVTPEEIVCLFGYNKFLKGTYNVADFIPDIHPVLEFLYQAHRGNEFAWLCPMHHDLATQEQRQKAKP